MASTSFNDSKHPTHPDECMKTRFAGECVFMRAKKKYLCLNAVLRTSVVTLGASARVLDKC